MAQSKAVESSAISKSVTNAGEANAKRLIINGMAGIIDRIFPILDEMQKISSVWKIFYIVFTILIAGQIIFVSFWVEYNTPKVSIVTTILKWVWKIMVFDEIESLVGEKESSIIILSVLFVILITTSFMQISSYFFQRRLLKKLLSFTRFVVEIIPPISLIPLGRLIGELLVEVIKMKGGTLLSIMLVISLIFFIIDLFVFYIISHTFCASSYVPNTVIGCWSPKFYFIFIAGFSIYPFLMNVSALFVEWIGAVFIAGKIVFTVYIIYELQFLPFIKVHTNVFFLGLFVGTISLDVTGIVVYAGVQIEALYCVVIFLVTFIISTIIWYFIIRKRIQKIKHYMSNDFLDTINPTDEAKPVPQTSRDQGSLLNDPKKRQLFINNRIDGSFNKSLLWIRVGIAQCCDRFLDWSLIKYFSEYHYSADSLCIISQVLSFFPCEGQSLNYFFVRAAQIEGLTVGNRFTLYQVNRIKNLRQSSTSSEVTEKILELRTIALQVISACRSFWNNIPNDVSTLYDIRRDTKNTEALFREMLQKWPNNNRLCDIYSTFLIEGSTNFREGLIMKRRSNLIELGKNFVKDIVFLSFVRVFTMYLKKKIVDVKGNFMINGAGGSGTQSSMSSLSSISLSNNDLDLEVEEDIAKTALSMHRLRLAFQKSLDKRHLKYGKYVKFYSCCALGSSLAIILVLFAWFFNLFNPRQESMKRLWYLNQVRYGFDAALTTTGVYWARKIGLISASLMGKNSTGLSMRSPKTNINNLQFSTYSHPFNTNINISHEDFAMLDEILRWSEFMDFYLEKYLSAIVILSSTGYDVKTSMSAMINPDVQFDFCTEENGFYSEMDLPINETLKSLLIYSMMNIRFLTLNKNSDATKWNNSKILCEVITNADRMIKSFSDLTKSMIDGQVSLKTHVANLIYYIMSGVIAIYLIVIGPPLFYFLYKTIEELNELLFSMKSFDKKTKDSASQLLKIRNDIEEIDNGAKTKNSHATSAFGLNATIIGFLLSSVSIFLAIIMISENVNILFLELNQWLYHGISRPNLMFESWFYSLLAVMKAQHPGDVPFIKMDYIIEIANTLLDNLGTNNNIILRGKEGLRPCIGINRRFDHLNFADDCHGNLNLGGFHDFYRCAGIDRAISLFTVLIGEILESPINVSMKLDRTFYHSFHLMNAHTIDPVTEATEQLSMLASGQISLYQSYLAGISVGGSLFLIIIFFLLYNYLKKLDVAFEGGLQLLRRLPPVAVSSNETFMEYLLNKKNSKIDRKMSSSMSAVMTSKNAIAILNKNLSIEIVNRSFTTTFGFTPEQLLGQSLPIAVPEDRNKKFFEQLELMTNGEASLVYETNGVAVNDNDQDVPIGINIIGIAKDSSSKAARSFVVILRDEVELTSQRAIAEEAKQKSEELLYQILPRDIVVRLNQGEKDISFVVPSASIIFIDIVKFSDYAYNLTPPQIMESLSMVFAAFDASLAKFNLITKIKLIGDVYMAAGGLFDIESNPIDHASQVVQFGLCSLENLDQVNGVLESSLQARVGVNTNGPLIGGVLGTEKPVFDIIGDPINVAARLQSTGNPGTVQISQDTYDLVKDQGFIIEQRGMIELKGKGKNMTYTVKAACDTSIFS